MDRGAATVFLSRHARQRVFWGLRGLFEMLCPHFSYHSCFILPHDKNAIMTTESERAGCGAIKFCFDPLVRDIIEITAMFQVRIIKVDGWRIIAVIYGFDTDYSFNCAR